jgi:hypothetical protein
LAGIPSAPVAFFMLILFIIFSTLSVVKNDPLLKTNYRPVSVLCIFSKIFEKILEQQLSDFFENICAFFNLSGKTL